MAPAVSVDPDRDASAAATAWAGAGWATQVVFVSLPGYLLLSALSTRREQWRERRHPDRDRISHHVEQRIEVFVVDQPQLDVSHAAKLAAPSDRNSNQRGLSQLTVSTG